MRRWVGLLWVVLAVLTPIWTVQADTSISFDTAEIDLWPEYDQPTMLVIYHLFLIPGTTLPATFSLHIPARAGDPANVATRQADGKLYNAQFTRSVSGDWSTVTVTATALEVQFEYYDPALVKNGSSRSFDYQWQGDYNINSLSIQVQVPISATNMQITPPLGISNTGSSGVQYFQSTYGTVKAGDKFTISLQYQKNNDSLTASELQVQASAPLTAQTPGRAPSLNSVLGLTLGILGVLLLTGGGIWFWRSGRSVPANRSQKRHTIRPASLPAKKDAAEDSTSATGAYCHQCGNRARAGDVFCRVCGTRLRRDES